ncbi:unnamed protein product [Dibothriocephalus latus]|uniref:Uncharacterized protein n=1 Tax=Dibothriocephalus latus TaxID=60516 RepID=A0A3P7Q0S5_DIBLA|nr:unnamed protein product [Dibothriocephalus latus]
MNKSSVSLVATTEVISLQEAHTDTQHIAPATTDMTSAAPSSSNVEDPINDGTDVMADIVADLACRVCGRLITNHPDPTGGYNGNGGSNNAMIECSLCHGLYHQLCHTPPLLGRLPTASLSSGNNKVDHMHDKQHHVAKLPVTYLSTKSLLV